MQPFSSCQSPMKEGRERRGRKQKKGRLEAWEKSRPWVTSVTKGLNNRMAQRTWTIVVAFPRQGRIVKHFFFFICATLDLSVSHEKLCLGETCSHATLPSSPAHHSVSAAPHSWSRWQIRQRITLTFTLLSQHLTVYSDLTWLNRHSWLWCFLQLH